MQEERRISNKVVMICWNIVMMIIALAYLLEVIKGERGILYFLIILLIGGVPLLIADSLYKKDNTYEKVKDCAAYAYASFHQEFMRDKVTLIGCTKLDGVDYSEKLTEILRHNEIQSVTIVRMEVPCCGGLEMATKKALQDSGKFLPWQVVTISIDGSVI